MKKTIVFDLDGTIANVDHRRHFVEGPKKDFDAFYAACGDDTPNEWAHKLIWALLSAEYRIVIVSARLTSLKEITEQWLFAKCYLDNNFYELHLLRDEANRSTPDAELKRRWLHNYGKDNILFVVDDRQRVVDMWRSEGVVCLQCDKWEES